MLLIRWCDVQSAGTRERAIVEDNPSPFRALISEGKLWSNKVIDRVIANSIYTFPVSKYPDPFENDAGSELAAAGFLAFPGHKKKTPARLFFFAPVFIKHRSAEWHGAKCTS